MLTSPGSYFTVENLTLLFFLNSSFFGDGMGNTSVMENLQNSATGRESTLSFPQWKGGREGRREERKERK